MLGDVLLITEKHLNAAKDIVKEVLANKKEKYIIAISGESGSGKSELAHAVAKELKTHKIIAKPLHIDNYYRILPLERTQWRKDNGIETAVGLGEYDWDTLYRNLEEFKGNHRMSQQLFGIGRLKDMPEVRKRAAKVLAGLEKGEI